MGKVFDEDLLPLKYGVFATNFLLWVGHFYRKTNKKVGLSTNQLRFLLFS